MSTAPQCFTPGERLSAQQLESLSTRLPRADVLGKPALEVMPEVQSTAIIAACERALTEKTHVMAEDYSATWHRWFEVSVFPLERGIAVYTRDVTERKHADQLRERLARYAALRADISATLAADRAPHLTNDVQHDPGSATRSGPSAKACGPSPAIRCRSTLDWWACWRCSEPRRSRTTRSPRWPPSWKWSRRRGRPRAHRRSHLPRR
ncbi:MAG TPA: PAS domain-containing protein [Polyangiaceae bacterium]